mmetsp:Transcript_85939/g.170607  ORF Transcript_85939/g.170607 Transcript_85939/m.170607 type:complete len:262 (-) Transcript_85939:670-1455(-)
MLVGADRPAQKQGRHLGCDALRRVPWIKPLTLVQFPGKTLDCAPKALVLLRWWLALFNHIVQFIHRFGRHPLRQCLCVSHLAAWGGMLDIEHGLLHCMITLLPSFNLLLLIIFFSIIFIRITRGSLCRHLLAIAVCGLRHLLLSLVRLLLVLFLLLLNICNIIFNILLLLILLLQLLCQSYVIFLLINFCLCPVRSLQTNGSKLCLSMKGRNCLTTQAALSSFICSIIFFAVNRHRSCNSYLSAMTINGASSSILTGTLPM